MGDLNFWKELDEADIVYYKEDNIAKTGKAISFTIPDKKRLVIDKIIIEPANTNAKHCYANVKFSGIISGSAYYDSAKDTENSKPDISGKSFHGDGKRKLTVDISSIQGEFNVRLMGFYVDINYHKTHKVVKITAREKSPDEIEITIDAPEDNGGNTIEGYEIHKSNSIDSGFSLLYDFDVLPENETDIKYTDSGLADNKTFYYKVRPRTTEGVGDYSKVVFATTKTDHPHEPTNLIVSRLSSLEVQLNWNAPTDFGGVDLHGYKIQRSINPDSGFEDIISDTKSLDTSYRDIILVTVVRYYYRIFAINTVDRESLIPSNVADIFVTYDAPTNLRITVNTDHKSTTLIWDAPIDTAKKPITGYKIERSTDNINYAVLVSNTSTNRTSYSDDTVDGATDYYYRVYAVIDGKNSPASSIVISNIQARAPTPPLNFIALSESDIIIGLSWNKPSDDGGSHIVGYKIQRSKYEGFPDGSGSPKTFTETKTPKTPITGPSTIEDTINVTDNFVALSVSVDVNISHTWKGDLKVDLVSPDGHEINLHNYVGGESDDLIQTYSGIMMKKFIGERTVGDWKLKIHDRYEHADNGTLNSWKLTIVKATEPITVINIGDVTTHSDDNLEPKTQYFYKIQAVSDVPDGESSSIANATTGKSLFGNGDDGDLIVAQNTIVKVTTDKNYNNVTIEDGGVLTVSNNIIKINGTYTENGTGKIKVLETGCIGGKAGVTLPGVLTAPGKAASCTDIQFAIEMTNKIKNIDTFITNFRNSIRGGKGSDGTAASSSGANGRKGNNCSFFRKYQYTFQGPGGGRGGTGAQGVDGVRGGGKFVLLVKTVATTLRIIATGLNGKNGNKGTGTKGGAGSSGRAHRARGGYCVTGNSSAGGSASSNGTLGSKGSQGGIVYVVYDTLTDSDADDLTIENSIDILGGIGGFNGNVSTASTPLLNTQAASGPDGLSIIRAISELT